MLQHELRKRLFETGLRALEMKNQKEVRETLDQMCGLIGFTAFTALEDEKNVFPTLAASSPFMVSLMEQEQEKNRRLSERLAQVTEMYEESISAEEKKRTIKMIRLSFNDWMTQVLTYLNKQQLVMQEMNDDVLVEEEELVLVLN